MPRFRPGGIEVDSPRPFALRMSAVPPGAINAKGGFMKSDAALKKVMILLFIITFLGIIGAGPALARYDYFGRFIPPGTPTVDGVLSPSEYNDLGHVTLYKFFGEDAKVDLYFMWDANYLYLGAKVEDFELWVDNYDSAKQWESTWNDDALKWEIDPNASADEDFQADDRVLAVNANGTAMRFDKGNGSGGTIGAAWSGDDVKIAASIDGILNDYTFKTLTAESQKDGGFVVEMAIRWSALFESGQVPSLVDGYALKMNVTNIEDDTGGSLDPEYDAAWKRVADELTRFMGEEDHPENWATFVLSSSQDTTAPAAISNLTTAGTGPFSTVLSFSATGDNGTAGYAKSYDIRYSTAPISEANWSSATVYKNNFRPAPAGQSEAFKVIGLSPQTLYYVGIKAMDERGNASALATTSVTTAAASGAADKGYLTVDPGGRYLAWESGTPFVVIGDNQGISWPHIRTFYNGLMWNDDLNAYKNFQQWDTGGIQDGRDYLKMLSDHGVNTIRIIAENLELTHPVYWFDDLSGGVNNISYNQDTLDFLKTFLDECADVGISVIVVPFDTFYYSTKFNGWSKVPFSTAMGGPMAVAEDFFESQYRPYIKAVLYKLWQTIGDRKNLLAWDLVNEFDSDETGIGWNRATFAKREATVNDLVDYLKSIDPNHMVLLSSVRWDPKWIAHIPTTDATSVTGNDAALVLNDDRFDLNSTHMYYHDIRDPNWNSRTNPASEYEAAACDLDNTIAPAARVKQGLQFYYAYSLTPKPYLCTEAGPIEFYTSAFDTYYTQADDNQIFHNMIWAYLASGEAGSGLRWPGQALADHELTDTMRGYQLAMRHFIDAGHIDFSGFQPIPIGQDMTLENTLLPVVKTGVTDGRQGIVFLVNDQRKAENPNGISGARLKVPDLVPGGVYSFDFWDTYDAAATAASSTVSATASSSGEAAVDLPAFAETQAIQFYCTDCPESGASADGVYALTGELSAKAVLEVQGSAPLNLIWREVGSEVNLAGARVVSGYFYTDPNDSPYGSVYNPEVFVKVYITADGWANIAFNHVTVDPVSIYSAHNYAGTWSQSGSVTLTSRLAEHTYSSGVSTQAAAGLTGTALPPMATLAVRAASAASADGVYALTGELSAKAVLEVQGSAPLNLIWREVGSEVNLAGARVVSGYFYTDPNDSPYGSVYNPEVFVKVYITADGWANIAFNHVTVDPVSIYSAHNYAGTWSQSGSVTLTSRLAEHTYSSGVSTQ